MKTPQTMTSWSAWSLGMMPSATQSATALATAYWAGPNICTAWVAPLMVNLVMRTVAGLAIRLGVRTASRLEWPWVWRARALAKATPTGPSIEPIKRSMWATSLPSPTRASPMNMDITGSLFGVVVCWVYAWPRTGLHERGIQALYQAERAIANTLLGRC